LEAFVPTTDYPTLDDLADYCIGIDRDQKQTNSLSRKEYALICSHKIAWEYIANDVSMQYSEWGLIFENDARLVPGVENPLELVNEALANKNNIDFGFVYLGICGSTRCTHAYAITKSFAVRAFEEIYCPFLSPCVTAQTDAAFEHYFRDIINKLPHVVGYEYMSPDSDGHRGIFYQCCRSSTVMQQGTSLTSPSVDIDGTYTNCYTHEWTGRLGNLMFQYASLAGICVKRGYPYFTCISLLRKELEGDHIFLPLKKFTHNFHVPYSHCIPNGKEYVEHGESIYDVRFDNGMFLQDPGTKLTGYFQSYKYFHPHASEIIKKIFIFRNSIKTVVEKFFSKVKQSTSQNCTLTCVSIRRGDKIGNSFYNQSALSTEYVVNAINHFIAKDNNTALLFFVGGSTTPHEIHSEREWVKKNLMEKYSHTHYTSIEPSVFHDMHALYAMSKCDNIVASSSSFSWWSAYLAGHNNVVAPIKQHENFHTEDYYPPLWHLL
jgi:hypothetical protein